MALRPRNWWIGLAWPTICDFPRMESRVSIWKTFIPWWYWFFGQVYCKCCTLSPSGRYVKTLLPRAKKVYTPLVWKCPQWWCIKPCLRPSPWKFKLESSDSHIMLDRGARSVAAVCKVATWNVATVPRLKHVGRYVQPRDSVWNRKNKAMLAQLTWLRGGLWRWECPNFLSRQEQRVMHATEGPAKRRLKTLRRLHHSRRRMSPAKIAISFSSACMQHIYHVNQIPERHRDTMRVRAELTTRHLRFEDRLQAGINFCPDSWTPQHPNTGRDLLFCPFPVKREDHMPEFPLAKLPFICKTQRMSNLTPCHRGRSSYCYAQCRTVLCDVPPKFSQEIQSSVLDWQSQENYRTTNLERAASGFGGFASTSQEARSDHGRKSPQPHDFAAAATTGHKARSTQAALLTGTKHRPTAGLKPTLDTCYINIPLLPAPDLISPSLPLLFWESPSSTPPPKTPQTQTMICFLSPQT